MKFKIRCESIKEFDAQKGAYVKCAREIEVDSAQVGSLVRCPACGNDVEVIDPAMLGSPELGSPELGSPEGQSSPIDVKDTEQTDNGWEDDPFDLAPLKLVETIAEEPSEEDEPFVDPVTEHPLAKELEPDSDTGAPVMGFSLTGTDSAVDTDTELKKESYNQTSGSVLRQASFGRSQTCQKCGALLEEKQAKCPNCQTPRQAVYVDKKDRKPFSRKGPFGFQLWLDGITKGPAKEGETDWFSTMALVFSIMLMGAGLIFLVIAGVLGIIVGPMVGFLGYSIFTAYRYWGAARKNPGTRIPLLGQFTWVIMLFFVRSMQFSKFTEEKKLDRNGDEEFGDQDLAEMKDLAKYRVVDLDGTSVSDEGLLYLYDLRGIHYLILRNTKVSEDAVHDLQQTIPKTWIWK